MSSKIFSGIFTRSIQVGMLVSIILFSFSLSVVAFEEWVPYVPYDSQVELSYWEEAGASYVNVLIEFPSSGYNVSNWGTLRIDGNTISVDAEIWHWTGLGLQVITYVSNDYNLGNLSAGKYLFVFGAWESPVRSTSFTVSGGYLEVDLPYLATHMEDFYDVMVRTNGIVKFYFSIYMYEDFWLEAQTGENILVVVRLAELPIPLQDSYIEVLGIIEYCELEGGFFYLNASSWYSALSPTTIYIDPASMTVASGEEFTVNIEIADVEDLQAWEVWISFDPTVVECIDVVEGPFLQSAGPTHFVIAEINNVTGYAAFACMLIWVPPPHGSGKLATVIFHCLGEGDTDLHLHKTNLLDSIQTRIPHDTVDGFVSQLLPTVYIFPQEIYLDEQTSNFTVNVNIRDLEASHQLVAIELLIEYNTTLLSFPTIKEGDFLKSFAPNGTKRFFIPSLPNCIMIIIMPPHVTRFPEGNGTLAAFSFDISLAEYSTLHLTSSLADLTGTIIPHTVENGIVRNLWNRADVNADDQVNILDLRVFAESFGSTPGQFRWNTNADLDGNQVVDIRDAVMIVKSFWQTASRQ